MISRSYLLSSLCCPVKCFGRVRVKVLSLPIRRLCQVSLLDVIVSLPHLRGRVPHNLHSRGGVNTRTSQVGCGIVSQVMEPKPTISLSYVLVPSRPPVYNTGSIWSLSLLRFPCPSPFVPTVAPWAGCHIHSEHEIYSDCFINLLGFHLVDGQRCGAERSEDASARSLDRGGFRSDSRTAPYITTR